MSSFFTVPASQRKRKRPEAPAAAANKRRSNVTSTAAAASGRGYQPRTARGSKANEGAADDEDDESISGSDSEEDVRPKGRGADAAEEDESSDDGQETAAERRLKLAERYLDNIRAELGEEADEVGFNAEDVDRELIAARLKEDVAEDQGYMYRFVAGDLDYSRATHTFFRADTLATTGVAVCPPYAYTVSKDMTLIKWELAPSHHTTNPPTTNGTSPSTNNRTTKAPPPPRRKPRQLLYTRGNTKKTNDPSFLRHTSTILCVAASSDGKFVATGGADRKLIIWDPVTLKPLKVFPQHRDAVTSLAFRGRTNQLFSASKDRTVKIWSLDELAYVETLFGHQDVVVDVSAVGGSEERCLSVGARDRSARLWKVVEESQLVFRGGGGGGGVEKGRGGRSTDPPRVTPLVVNDNTEDDTPRFSEGSLDRVAQPTTSLFVTGSDSGALSTYALHKKKAMHIIPIAHGFDAALAPELSSAEADAGMDVDGVGPKKTAAGPTARWITALTCVPFSDLVVSASWDGCVRCWRLLTADAPNGAGAGVAKGMARLEPVGVLGSLIDGASAAVVNGVDGVEGVGGQANRRAGDGAGVQGQPPVRGVINDLKVFLRGDRGKDGVCVVAAVGTETRLGRWVQRPGKNGAVVFEIPRKGKSAAA